MAEKYKFENELAETLLIPLYMRVKETKREKNSIIKDYTAEKIIDKFEYDFSKIDKAKLSALGCVIRTWFVDKKVKEFIKNNEHPVVVNIGCGLDTRAQRIGDDGKTIFYESDLPEVISIREKIIDKPINDNYISASLLDREWMEELKRKHLHGNFLFALEGVLMFFTEDEIYRFIQNIIEVFSTGELWFDISGTLMYKKRAKPDSLKNSNVNIKCGISDGQVLAKRFNSLSMIEQVHYMKFFRNRWGFLLGQIIGRMPKLCYKISSIIGYKIN